MLYLVIDGKQYEFKNGYDLWHFSMLHKPRWFLSEKMTDNHEIADIMRNAKARK